MDKGRQSFLVGPSADAFARESGVTMVSNSYFTTATKKARWEAQAGTTSEPSEDLETVGAVALDLHANLAAAMKGRVGDTAILGAGLSVDQNVAVVW